MKNILKLTFVSILSILFSLNINAQVKQNGLLWQVTGNGLKKPSYVYGTMHVSQKIAFHLGDSFYLALSKCDIVALEQDLDSVIHRWITESEFDNPEDAEKVYPRNSSQFLNFFNFTLNSYDKDLLKRKLSAEVREVNYLLQRGEQDDFEEDAWLDLYIYQLAKKLKKGFTGVEGYEESRDLVKKANKEPNDAKKKKPKRFNYKLRMQVAEAYRTGNIQLIDSIDRLTESEHYLEYMLYKRNANMVRRMDSIMRQGNTLFTGVGCSHLPGTKGVLQMLIDMGYQVRPVQSIALEKSKMAKKIENKKIEHKYSTYTSEDGLISAILPTRLTKVNNNSYISSYLSPDLANGYYYQIEKITCNSIFSGKSPEDVLRVIDTLIFENIPGEITSKKNILSNGFNGMEVVTMLKTGDLNRFQILASPFYVYIIRMSGKKNFAISSDANNFFKSIKIIEGNASVWQRINSPDSVFSLDLPSNEKTDRLPMPYKGDPSFEHLVYEKNSGNTYLIKQEDILNQFYLEQDTFELDLMAESFSKTDDFVILSKKHFVWNGYNALDAEFANKNSDKLIARFVISGTRYIMFLMKPNNNGGDFNDRFFTSIKFNGKPTFQFIEYKDTSLFYTVKTPILPLLTKARPSYSFFGASEVDDDNAALDDKYKGSYKEVYYMPKNSNEFISVGMYRYGYYEKQYRSQQKYFDNWEKKHSSLRLLHKSTTVKKGINYVTLTYTDTNTTRQIKVLHALNGKLKYTLEAYLDTVSGKSDFIENFFNTFDISDTLLDDDIFKNKGYRFFADFTSNDSATRKASIKYFDDVTFYKEDITNICNVIDTISMKGDAAQLRSSMIQRLGEIDSAAHLIVPYLQKLYNRFSDTAYMQIEIINAISAQQNEKAFNAIKPILANDIPISDNSYSMELMLSGFGDSLKLTKIILPELIELTTIPEYRNTAYQLMSRMKDSGIINETDYASIHEKLIKETKIEYKRIMANLTREKDNSSFDTYDFYRYNIKSSYSIFSNRVSFNSGNYNSYYKESYLLSDMLDLSLPLRNKYSNMQDLLEKILKITDNETRLNLLPVLLKYNINFNDTVYTALAKNLKTRTRFYNVLAEAGKSEKFPAEFHNQKDWVSSEIHRLLSDEEVMDSIVFIEKRLIIYQNDSAIVHICKYRIAEEDEWSYFISEALPLDSNKLNDPKKSLLMNSISFPIIEEMKYSKIMNTIFFDNLLRLTRNRNGGYYDSYLYGYNSASSWDY
ncbi:MAG: TraB/GumN family protein [Bacteroidia bacterium]|nr:TraB/GumN family protein [Bacteroidia bacterium]